MKITKGDYKVFKFQRKSAITGEIITNLPQKMFFTIKDNIYTDSPLIQKTLENGITYDSETKWYRVEILPSDTDNLASESLVCDIQVNYSDTKKKTIYTGEFLITLEVTFAENEVSELNGEEVEIESLNEEEVPVITEAVTYVGGVLTYAELPDKPKINGKDLVGNTTTEELGILDDVKTYIDENKEELRGLPGEKGDTGEQGPQGIPGKDGVHGVVIYDTDDDEIIKAQLLSLVDEKYNLITPAFLISDYMMLFVLADVDTEDGKKQFRFKAGNLVNMKGQNMSYSVEILYRISDTGELEKDYATGMFYDNEAIMQNVNNAIDEKITGALGGDY